MLSYLGTPLNSLWQTHPLVSIVILGGDLANGDPRYHSSLIVLLMILQRRMKKAGDTPYVLEREHENVE
jgi:hypothetical protein